MKVNCCYRCISTGEVIHTLFDTDTRLMDIMPASFFDTTTIPIADYNPASYVGRKDDWAAECEACLLHNNERAMCIEVGAVGYYILQWNGLLRLVKSPMDDKDEGFFIGSPYPGKFKYIGYRPTRMLQYRSSSGIYRLTYDTEEGTVVTSEGILMPEFDVSGLSEIDYNYTGYKEMLANGYFAVVYRNNTPVFLARDGNRLVELS